MMLVGRRVVLAAMLLASTACQGGPPVKPLPLRLVADVPLGQPTSRYDYESIDPKTGLLFIADLAESRVLVFDTHTNKLIKTISNIMHVHGVITVRAQGRAYATATGTDELVTIDESTLEIIQNEIAPLHTLDHCLAHPGPAEELQDVDEPDGQDRAV